MICTWELKEIDEVGSMERVAPDRNHQGALVNTLMSLWLL